MARRRRRGVRRLILLAALVVWLGVSSSSGPAPERGPSEPLQLTRAPETVPDSRGTTVDPDAASSPVEAPAVSSEPPEPEDLAARAATRDRFRGYVRAMSSDDLAAALVARREVMTLALDDAEREELATVIDTFEPRLDASIARLITRAAAGEVLSAARALREVLEADTSAIEGPLAAALRSHGVQDRPPAPDAALPRGTAIRWLDEHGSEHRGEVYDCGAVEVIVRVRTVGGYVFPTMSRLAVEPLAAEESLARSQHAAATAAKDELLARLWAVRVAALVK